MSGRQATIDLGLLLSQRLQIKGFIMRRQSIAAKRKISQRFQARWLPQLINGAIKPIIDTVFPLTRIKEAHRYMEADRHFGKIIVNIDE